MPKFDGGGYTGPGGRLEAAGVVHKGELVWSQDDVQRVGGVANAEALRKGFRGYADGGYVNGDDSLRPRQSDFSTPREVMKAATSNANSNSPQPVDLRIINQFEDARVEKRQVPDGRGGKREEILIREAFVQGASTRQGQQAMNQPRVATR